jgi:hypothetical protein
LESRTKRAMRGMGHLRENGLYENAVLVSVF